ncbi:MAG: hypothetical protein Q8O88_05975 [bacterium]|nr:hypothetical protein [bacterium]
MGETPFKRFFDEGGAGQEIAEDVVRQLNEDKIETYDLEPALLAEFDQFAREDYIEHSRLYKEQMADFIDQARRSGIKTVDDMWNDVERDQQEQENEVAAVEAEEKRKEKKTK